MATLTTTAKRLPWWREPTRDQWYAFVAAWLGYELPPELVEKTRHFGWRGQRQKWFVMLFTGDDHEINLAAEHAEFSAWKWVPARDLPELIVSFKRQIYIDLLAEFPALTRGPYHSLAELMAEMSSITGGAVKKLP